MFTKVVAGKRKYLISLKPEIGCFDKVEFGPSIQTFSETLANEKQFKILFENNINKGNKVLNDVILSEEGGRFYHEQNRNVIIEIEENELNDLPYGYIWVNYATLNNLCMFNNYLNIQLRSLMSLIDL